MASASKNGLTDNSVGALAYMTPIMAFFFLAVQRYNKRPFVRFHAWQSLVFGAFIFLFLFALNLALPYAALLGPRVLWGIQVAVGAVGLVLFLLWIWCVVNALNGKCFKIPIIGKWADEQAFR